MTTTIREIRPVIGPISFDVSCVRCGEHIAGFNNPEYAQEAIEHYGGEIVVDARNIEDCVVACAACKDKSLCSKCGSLLEADICPNCPVPLDVREFVEMYPGDFRGMSVYACAVVIDIGNGELVALGETAVHVWGRIRDCSYPVAGVLYAGDDRNLAIEVKEAWNKKYYKRP